MAKRGRPPSSSDGASDAVAKVAAFRSARGWSEARFARAAGVSQSAANRSLQAVAPRWTPTLKALASYAENPGLSVSADSVLPEVTLIALGRLWNGSDADADRIARLLTLIKEFRKTGDEIAAED